MCTLLFSEYFKINFLQAVGGKTAKWLFPTFMRYWKMWVSQFVAWTILRRIRLQRQESWPHLVFIKIPSFDINSLSWQLTFARFICRCTDYHYRKRKTIAISSPTLSDFFDILSVKYCAKKKGRKVNSRVHARTWGSRIHTICAPSRFSTHATNMYSKIMFKILANSCAGTTGNPSKYLGNEKRLQRNVRDRKNFSIGSR